MQTCYALPTPLQLPAEDERNGVINGYTIEYRLISGGRAGDPVMVNLSVPSGGNAGVIYALMDLNGGGTYEVQVGAFTAAGVGPLTDSVTVVTFQGQSSSGGFIIQVTLSLCLQEASIPRELCP